MKTEVVTAIILKTNYYILFVARYINASRSCAPSMVRYIVFGPECDSRMTLETLL